MSYKVLDVCRHVINYSNEHDYGISNLKLQKVLYFIQAYFLTKKKVVLCQEKVQIKYALLVLSYPAKASAFSSNAA